MDEAITFMDLVKGGSGALVVLSVWVWTMVTDRIVSAATLRRALDDIDYQRRSLERAVTAAELAAETATVAAKAASAAAAAAAATASTAAAAAAVTAAAVPKGEGR